MTNVYIEPMPNGSDSDIPTEYQIEFQDEGKVGGPFKTQKEAIDQAKRLGHKPLVAHVRHTSKGNADHWCSAD